MLCKQYEKDHLNRATRAVRQLIVWPGEDSQKHPPYLARVVRVVTNIDPCFAEACPCSSQKQALLGIVLQANLIGHGVTRHSASSGTLG